MSSSCSLTCFSLLHTSYKLVVSSKDWRKFRFSGIIHQESSQLLLMSKLISGFGCGQPDPSITNEILYIPVNRVVLLTVDNHCLHPWEVAEWWFSILSLFLHLLAIILYGRTYQLFGTLKYSSYKKKKKKGSINASFHLFINFQNIDLHQQPSEMTNEACLFGVEYCWKHWVFIHFVCVSPLYWLLFLMIKYLIFGQWEPLLVASGHLLT